MKWKDIISEEKLNIGLSLAERANSEREQGKIICPPQDQIFSALTLTPPETVKVVIIGQDPYHTPDQANGLAFSVSPGHPLQPSLRNIFKEYRDDLGYPQPQNGDLTPWAEQGVLLLNTSLTVEAHNPNSHSNWGWQSFTEEILRACVFELSQPIVFLVWGKNAEEIVKSAVANEPSWNGLKINRHKIFIFSSHPSPFSANRGSLPFLGSKPFSKANFYLEQMGVEPIDWRL